MRRSWTSIFAIPSEIDPGFKLNLRMSYSSHVLQLPDYPNEEDYQIIPRRTSGHLRTLLKKLSLSSIHKTTPPVIIPTPTTISPRQAVSDFSSSSSSELIHPLYQKEHEEIEKERDAKKKAKKRDSAYEQILVWNMDSAFVSR